MTPSQTPPVPTDIDTDVLISGGGPCGLMLAIELGRRGIRCLLVDAKPGTAFNPQANATQARTMEHFRRLGFADEVRALGLPADHPTDIAYFTRYAQHELARIALPTAAQAVVQIKTLGGAWSAAELPHRVSQKFVEQVLRRHAQTPECNDIRYGWTLEAFEDSGQAVQARIRPSAGGAVHKVRAQFLVGADGARSRVRQALGIEWGGETGIQREFMGGKMFAIYLRAPQFQSVLRHPKAWMYVAVNHQRRAFMASVDGVAEYAFHAALKPGEDAEQWTHMPGDDVAAQAVVGAQGFFQVDAALLVQAAGAGQRLGRDVNRELVAGNVQGGDGHASAIERDAVPQSDVVEVPGRRLQGEALAMV